MRIIATPLLLALLGVSAAAIAQQPEIKVDRLNDENYLTQIGDQTYPAIASASGGFTTVWLHHRPDGGNDVVSRRYNENAQVLGSCVRVNDDTVETFAATGQPRVVRQFPTSGIGNITGNYVVVWDDMRSPGGDILAQVFRDDGLPIGRNFEVNDDAPAGSQGGCAIGMWPSPTSAASAFAVAWVDSRNGNPDIYVRWFGRNSDGSALPAGPAIRVNDDTGAGQLPQIWPSIAVGPIGQTVVVWSDGRAGGPMHTWGQIFNPNGTRRGVNFQVDNLVARAIESRVAIKSDGSFVVAFQANNDVVIQRCDANGRRVGDTVHVNADTGMVNEFPEISLRAGMDATGWGFVVTWVQKAPSTNDGDVHFRAFSGDGSPASADLTLPQARGSGRSFPAVAEIGYGGINPPFDRSFVCWQETNPTTFNFDVRGQVLERFGFVDSPFEINECYGGADQMYVSIDANANGDVVAAWEDMRDGLRNIYAKRFSRDMVPIGSDFRIDDDAASNHVAPKVAVRPDGSFVVAWTRWDIDSSSVSVRRFDAGGVPLGPSLRVNDATSVRGREVAIASALDGSFSLVWTDTRVNPDGDIFLQRYSPDGAPVADNRLVSMDSLSLAEHFPDIAYGPTGDFIVVWADQSASGSTIRAQRFDAGGLAVGSNFTLDGAGSGTLPAIGRAPDGTSLVAWLDFRRDPRHADVMGRFLRGGAVTGSELVLNDSAGVATRFWPEYPHPPAVAAAVDYPQADTTFVVVWTDYRHSDPDIYAQWVPANGVLQDSNKRLSPAPEGTFQIFPSIARSPGANTYVGWSDNRVFASEGWSVWGTALLASSSSVRLPGTTDVTVRVLSNGVSAARLVVSGLDRRALARIEVRSVTGAILGMVLERELSPGVHEIPLDLHQLCSGTYFVRASLGGRVYTSQLVIAR